MVVKYSTLAGGVWIEVKPCASEYSGGDRCFRFDQSGNAEWAAYADLASNNPMPRWFGHAFKYKDFILC